MSRDEKTQRMTFPGSRGAPLAGVLHLPREEPQGSVLLAHCFTCSKDLHTMTRLSRGLTAAGYAVLRFDFTGLGESGGEFTATTVSHNVRDLVAAATALIKRGHGPCRIVGHSLGGAAALLAAERLHTVRSVAAIGAPARPSQVRSLFRDHVPYAGSPSVRWEEAIHREGEAVVEIAGRPFPISLAFLDDLERHDASHAAAELGRPLLVMHAVRDDVIPVGEGERLFDAAQQPKAFWPMPEADHLLTSLRIAERALAVLLNWLSWTS